MTEPANRALFIRMLSALGRKDYDAFEDCLAEDLLCEWPYAVMEGFPAEMIGGGRLRQALEASFASFTPYDYEILEIHELADPDALIAEYRSRSVYLPRNLPYRNRYVGIIRFAHGRISRWREYVNPLVVIEALGPEMAWQETVGATAKPDHEPHNSSVPPVLKEQS